MKPSLFHHQVLSWFDSHGRKDLPWQRNITPYRIWLSEIMLQQTQVTTVIPYFEAFVQKFPSVEVLGRASVDDVLSLWSGLGYYARARNLHKTAQIITEQGGVFPNTVDALLWLPGIGLSTAGAILSIAFQQSHPILDGNVKRVLARFNAISGWPGESITHKKLWAVSTHFTPKQRVADYTQAIMDLGATVCTRRNPACNVCPLYDYCQARITNTVASLPTPKPKKTLPVKQLVLLLLQNTAGYILLEKRPAYGIWGGLWSVPEFSTVDSVKHWCLTHHVTMVSHKALEMRRHTFSHYHLDYTPILIQTNSTLNGIILGEKQLWCNEDQINNLGLAAPVKLLLQHYLNKRG